jgi:WD40 repeat protein
VTHVYDVQRGVHLQSLHGHTGAVSCLQVQDGYLLSGSRYHAVVCVGVTEFCESQEIICVVCRVSCVSCVVCVVCVSCVVCVVCVVCVIVRDKTARLWKRIGDKSWEPSHTLTGHNGAVLLLRPVLLLPQTVP